MNAEVKVADDDIDMPCDYPGCGAESTHSRSVWVAPGHMRVDYFCPEHAPADATTFEEDEAEERLLRAEEDRS